MTLYKRGNVYWAYWYDNGIRHQHSTGTSNRRHAEQIEQKLKDEANLQRFQIVRTDPNMTFKDLAARFIASGKPTAFHLKELKQLMPFFADYPVVRLNKALAREYREARHRQKPLCDATINRALACLRRILNWAADESLIPFNPLTRLHLEKEPRTRRTIISVTDEDRLIDNAPEHLKAMITACRHTGMRRGEILNQLWEDVDLARGVLLVSKSKTSGGQFRELPIATPLYDLLVSMRKRAGPVFTYESNGVKEIKTAWRNLCTRVLGHRIRFHDLRHAMNTRLVHCGIIADIRRAVLGHSTGRDTNSIYTHIDLTMKKTAIEKLESWIIEQRQRERLLAEQTKTQQNTAEVRNPLPHQQ